MLERIITTLNSWRVLKTRLNVLETEVDFLRSKLDISEDFIASFEQARETQEYQSVFAKAEPLVSICIGTYNRANLLVERSVTSALRQTYKNIEIIVVGDHCTDNTEERISTIKDDRLKFLNLSQRGNYPSNPEQRWMVAGTAPFNEALKLSCGDFITHLDDDDEHLPDRVEKLVRHAQKTKADLIYHPFYNQKPDGKWFTNQATEFRKMQATTSSIFYHRWFSRLPWDINAYKYHEPGDWNRLRKIRYLGANIVRYPEPLLRHYRERNQE